MLSAIFPKYLSLRLNVIKSTRPSLKLFTTSNSADSAALNLDGIDTNPDPKDISPYWKNQLNYLQRPAAKILVSQLSSSNILGYDNPTGIIKKGTLLEYILHEKSRHKEKVILCRVGEFYETFGIDAIMLVEHCGLNSMGGRTKAGCPIKNLQQTLDGLTKAGLSAVVYEELIDINAAKGPSVKSKLKTRALTQVISPGSPNYIYNNLLNPTDIEYKEARPYLGINYIPSSGFTTVEIYVDQKSVVVNEKMTIEGINILIDSKGFSEPLYIQNIDTSSSSTSRFLNSISSNNNIKIIKDYPDDIFVSHILNQVATDMELSVNDFRIINRGEISNTNDGNNNSQRPLPLYTSTASQIGLLNNNEYVPDLIKYLLPINAPAHSSRFLRKWLLSPPPYKLADSMRILCGNLRYLPITLPRMVVTPIGKVVTLLSAKQANALLFNDLKTNLNVIKLMLSEKKYKLLKQPLLDITSYESGILCHEEILLKKSEDLIHLINSVIYNDDDGNSGSYDDDEITTTSSSTINDNVLNNMFINNEIDFRKKVLRTNNKELDEAYNLVSTTALELINVVNDEYPDDIEMIYDSLNNVLSLKNKPKNINDDDNNKIEFIAQLDRNKKPMLRRYTTQSVVDATSNYINACEKCKLLVEIALQKLSSEVYNDIAIVVQASHWCVILQAASLHTISSLQKGWILPVLESDEVEAAYTTLADTIDDEVNGGYNNDDDSGSGFSNNNGKVLQLDGLIPYWLSTTTGAITNTFSLKNLFLLTAPNMSGKSTLLRSTLVTALLANSGLLVPCLRYAKVPRYDTFFIRTASYDVPAEGKSAFGLEMDDMRVILRDATDRSLVMIDELGKGTSSRDGTALAGALLEHLESIGVSGIFATHLHELFQLPINVKNINYKKMGMIIDSTTQQPRWTFKLKDGICTDSLATNTARKYGLPESLINRAESLSKDFDQIFRASSGSSSSGTGVSSVSGGSGSIGSNSSGIQPPQTMPLSASSSLSPIQPPVVETLKSAIGGHIKNDNIIDNINTNDYDDMIDNLKAYNKKSPSINEKLQSSKEQLESLITSPTTTPFTNTTNGFDSYYLDKTIQRISIDDISNTIGRLSGSRKSPVVIEYNSEPPVSLEGKACVYLLIIHGNNDIGDRIYVGETESISQRLKQHRQKRSSQNKKNSKITAIVIGAPNKSSARGTETLLIAALKGNGYDVEGGGSDGSHRLFAQN